MDRCHLYLPLIDSSGASYAYAEVTLLDPKTDAPLDQPVYLQPIGGAPQRWPILVDPAVVNLWLDAPARVTLQALLPGGSTLTRTGVDIAPAPSSTVRTTRPLRIGSAAGLSSDALLAVSPGGTAAWQVLDALRDHRHEGDAPNSTVLGMEDLQDIYPGQTWLGADVGGQQGANAVAVGPGASPNADEAVSVGPGASAGLRSVAVGGGASGQASSVVLGAGATAVKPEQQALGRNADATAGPDSAIVLGAGSAAEAETEVKATGLHARQNNVLALGSGVLPDLSSVGEEYTAILGNAIAPRFFAARDSASMAGTTSLLGFFGSQGGYRTVLNTSAITPATPGYTALLSLSAALDQLGLIYLTDGAVDDELVDWAKSLDHSNMVLETGDTDGSKGGDLNRARRSATGPGTITYQVTTGVRDIRLHAFVYAPSGTPANHQNQITVQVSTDGAAWTSVPLGWQPLQATAADWGRVVGENAQPLPPSMRYLRVHLDLGSSATSPQLGRVIVRQRPSLDSIIG
ncbi:hypothetical protein ACWD7M_16755 [Streptomyces griseus]